MITDKVGGSSAKPEVSKQSKEKRLKHKVSGYKSQSKRRSIAGCRLLLRTLTLSFETLELWSYPSKHCNSDLILPNIGIAVLSFQTLEFWFYLSKHYNSYGILPNTGILTISNQTLTVWPYPFKHWNCVLFLPNIGILTVSVKT